MTNDPNVPAQPGQPQPFNGPAGYQPQPPHNQQQAFAQQGFGAPPPPHQNAPLGGPGRPKSPFGPSFWIVSVLLALVALGNATTGRGESLLIFIGIAFLLTGLYSLIFKRRSWAALPGKKAAIVVAVSGAASLLLGSIAAGVERSQDARLAAQPVTAVELEADIAAKLSKREEDVKKAEDAVKAREAAVGGKESTVAANTIKEGTWTVGIDIVPGVYRTTAEVTHNCSWDITRTGSNGSDHIDRAFYVKGGFPMVTLAEGQTFNTEGCGKWAKQ